MSDIAHMFAPFNAEQNVQKWNPGIDNDHMANIRGMVSPALANTESSSMRSPSPFPVHHPLILPASFQAGDHRISAS
jgi:hypothetical protein